MADNNDLMSLPPEELSATPSDGLTDEEFFALASQAPEEPAPVSGPSARVNVLNPQMQPTSLPREVLDEALRSGYRLDTSEIDFTRPVSLLENGRVNTYAPDDPRLMEALNAGALLATPSEIEAEYGDVGSMLATGLEGLARGVTLGLSDVVAGAVGGDSYTAERQLREEINPGTAIGTEILGAAGTALATGGTGAVGAAARLTPAGKLAQLSTKLGTALTESMGARAAGRIGALVIEGATEGAVDNAIRTVTKDIANGDVEITAERMIDAAWDGALYGGIASGLFGAAIEGAGAAARKIKGRGTPVAETADELTPTPIPDEQVATARPAEAIDQDLTLAEQRLAEAEASGDPTLVQEAEAQVNALLAEKDAAVLRAQGVKTDDEIRMSMEVQTPEEVQGFLRRIGQSLRKAKNAQELSRRFDDAVEDLTRKLTDRLDNVQRDFQNHINPQISRNNKPKAIAKALESEVPVWTFGSAERILRENEEALAAIRELRADYALGDEVARRKLAPLKAAEQAIEGIQKHLTELKGKGPLNRDAGISPGSKILRGDPEAIAQVFWAEDSLKNYLGQIAKKKGETVTTAEAVIQRIYMKKRAALQDKRLYGGIAEMQTATNAVESKAIPANHIFHERFGLGKNLIGEHAGEHGFEGLLEIDPADIENLLRNLGDAKYAKHERDFINGLERRVELAEVKAKYYPVSDAVRQKIANARQTVEEIKNLVKETKLLKRQRDLAKRAAEDGSSLEAIIQLVENLPGSGFGLSAVGSIARKTLDTVAAGLEALGARTEQAIASSTDRIVEHLRTVPPGVEALGRGAVKTEQAIDSAANKAVKTYIIKGERPARVVSAAVPAVTAVNRAIEEARALTDPRSEQARNFRAQLEELAAESPELAAAIEAKAMRKAEFILSKLPPVDDRDPFLPGVERPMDRVTQAKVARYISAARNPRMALERLATGAGSAEDRETLQALYPALYARWGEQVMRKAVKAKKPPTVKQRQALAFATGLPAAAWHDPDFAAFLQPGPGQQEDPAQADSLKPMVTPGRSSAEFSADNVYASRTDQIMNPHDW